MPRGPVLQPLLLKDQEIAQLTAWSPRPKASRALAERAAIILASASGAPTPAVAAAVGVTRQTVGLAQHPRYLLHFTPTSASWLIEPQSLLAGALSFRGGYCRCR